MELALKGLPGQVLFVVRKSFFSEEGNIVAYCVLSLDDDTI